ncbi:MAG: hypothetical protein MUO72_02490 [Bacteroidales bacterium]|nr:hypothetical protein [Bacteroidales bacterium]
MLPYANTKHNREKGYRISVMPAITKDIKIWFENVGWHKPENWPKVGDAIFQLIYEVIEKKNYNSFAEFESKYELSKGFKSGFISPTLFFLNSKYRIINNKTILTVNFILEKKAIDRDLANYMKYVSIIDELIPSLEIDLLNEPEKFDMFCHFMCDKRLGGYAKYIGKSSQGFAAVEIDEEEIAILDNDLEPSGHWEAVYYITQIGKLLGYKTYVADPSREAFGKKLGDIADLSEVPPILKTAPFKEFEDRYNFRTYEELFDFYKEVKNYTEFREKFLRL